MEIFKLFGSIFIRDEEAQKKIDGIDEKGKKAEKTLGDMIGTAAKWGAGIAAGAAAGAAAIGGLVAKTIETTAEINKFSQVTGMTTEGFQQWDFVMKNFGYSAEQASGDLAALAEKALDAANGVGEGAELFNMLGVTVTDTSGKLKTQEQIFSETITALQGMEDVTKRNAIATALLSTTGEELAPVLNMTTAELQAMKENANVISEEDIQKAEKFRLGWNEVKNTFSTVVTEIGIRLLPVLQGLFDWISRYMPAIQETVKIAFGAVNIAISAVTTWIKQMIDWLKSLFAENESTFTGIQTTITEIFNQVVAYLQEKIEIITAFWEEHGEQIKSAVENVFTAIRETIEFIMPIVEDVIKLVWESIKVIIDTSIGVIMGAIKLLTGLLTGDWKTAWEGAKQIVSSIWSGIEGLVKNGVNFIIEQLNKMIKALNRIKFDFPDWIPNLGGRSFGLDIPTIPMLAEGGVIEQAGRVLVGEKGPELLDLPRGAQVTPLSGNAGEYKEATIQIFLDSKEIAKKVRQPLVDMIRVQTGLRT